MGVAYPRAGLRSTATRVARKAKVTTKLPTLRPPSLHRILHSRDFNDRRPVGVPHYGPVTLKVRVRTHGPTSERKRGQGLLRTTRGRASLGDASRSHADQI